MRTNTIAWERLDAYRVSSFRYWQRINRLMGILGLLIVAVMAGVDLWLGSFPSELFLIPVFTFAAMFFTNAANFWLDVRWFSRITTKERKQEKHLRT